MTNPEASTLLPSEPQLEAQQHERRHTNGLRVALGVASALALVAVSVVAVDMISAHQQHHQHQPTAQLVQTASLDGVAPETLEADLGWDTWCGMRATVECLFSSDKDACEEEIMETCDPEDEFNGSGSGSGAGWNSGSHATGHGGDREVGDDRVPSSTAAGSRHEDTPGVPGAPNVGDPEKPKRRRNRNKIKNKRTQSPAHVPHA